jgi:hypothetical protein
VTYCMSNFLGSQQRRTPRVLLPILLALAWALPDSAQTPVFATLHNFSGPDGAKPHGNVTLDKDGNIYGTTFGGGPNVCYVFNQDHTCGTIFSLTPSAGGGWTESVLHAFSGPDGAWPGAELSFGSNGILYGSTETGTGSAGGGTVFELVPPSTTGGTWTLSTIYTFPSNNGSISHTPDADVLVFPNGSLYTTAQTGTAIELLPPAAPGGAWTESTIFKFNGNAPIGTGLFAGLVSHSGTLYGVTYDGSNATCGSRGCGAAYALTPPSAPGAAWTGTALHSFDGFPSDGAGPLANLTVGRNGVLYGTTFVGGSGTICDISGSGGGCGTVFQLTPPSTPGGSWTEAVLYSFTGENGDGAYPSSTVLLGKDGLIYGTTQSGGTAISGPCASTGVSGCGTIFQLIPPVVPGGVWTEKVLHSFTGQNGEGNAPEAGLTAGSGGVFYGTTYSGGYAGLGTVFSIKP